MRRGQASGEDKGRWAVKAAEPLLMSFQGSRNPGYSNRVLPSGLLAGGRRTRWAAGWCRWRWSWLYSELDRGTEGPSRAHERVFPLIPLSCVHSTEVPLPTSWIYLSSCRVNRMAIFVKQSLTISEAAIYLWRLFYVNYKKIEKCNT